MNDGVLLRDRDWASIEGQLCLVTEFVPMAGMKNGQVIALGAGLPYASVTLNTEDGRELKGFITHKTDFAMLWAAFNQRTEVTGVHVDIQSDVGSQVDLCLDRLGENEEVWLVWTRKNYRTGVSFLKSILPKLIVMVSRKGALELVRNPQLKPELTGRARFLATRPLITWTPEIMNR